MNPIARLQRLDLHSLHLFASVAKDGSITRAAERSHIAASALSRRLADLEHAIGATLFVRSRKGIQVTDVGRAVLLRAERIQDELRCLLDDAAALQQAQVRLRLYASHSVISGVLPELLRAFKPAAENLRLEICEASSQEVLSACADGAADVAIGLRVRAPLPDSVECWELLPDRLQVVMREEHLLARGRAVRFEQALAFPLIGSDPKGALSLQLQQEAARLGLCLAPQVSAGSFSAACRLAETGFGLAIMPGSAIPSDLSLPLVQRPLLDGWAQRSLMIYVSSKRSASAGVSALLLHLRRQSRMVSTLRLQRENLLPAGRVEAQLTVPALLPVECEVAVDGA